MSLTIRNFDEAAETIIDFMSRLIPVNTIFIAKNDQCSNEIEKVWNREDILLKEGDVLPFEDTYCKLSVNHGNQILTIEDLKDSSLTKDMNVTHNLGGGSFIGIPLYYSSGENYGTICGLDAQPFEFTEEHKNMFQTMASLLSYVLDLDRVNKEVEELSAPMVSLTEGLAVLPIIGYINEKRAKSITQATLYNSTRLSLKYLVIDLSGMQRINKVVSRHLLDIVQMLRLIGVVPILTGIQPAHARQMADNHLVLDDVLVKNSLEAALAHIGFSLVNTNQV